MVLIADLVARVRTEGVDQVEQGAKRARQELAGVGQEARATGDQLDQLARKFAATQGGTASGWREILEKQALSAGQVAQQLGTASTSANRLASAAQQIAAPTQAAAAAAGAIHQGFSMSEASIGRFALGVVGIGAGLSIATKLATELHGAISGIVQGQLTWERSLKETAGVFGPTARNAVAMAQALATAPGLVGSQQVFAQANLQSAYLSSRYGMSTEMRGQLLATAGRVAAARGLSSDQDAAAQQKAFLEAVESGGTSLRDLNIEVDPEIVARRLGFASGDALEALTPQQQRLARASIAIQGGNQYVQNARLEGRAALDAQTGGQRSLQQARDQLQNMLEQQRQGMFPPEAMTGGAEGAALGFGLQMLFGDDDTKRRIEEQQKAIRDLDAQQAQLNKTADEWRVRLGNIDKAQLEATTSLQSLTGASLVATSRLLSARGSIEDPQSLKFGDLAARALAETAAHARGPNPIFGMSDSEIAVQATSAGWLQAYQGFDAQRSQGTLRQANTVRAYLQGQAAIDSRLTPEAGTVSPALDAQRALAEGERRSSAMQTLLTAQRAGGLAQLQLAEAQANADEISLRQRGRELDVNERLIDARGRELSIARESLDVHREVIEAQQRAAGPGAALQELDYGDQRTSLLAQVRQVRLLEGQDVSDLPTTNDLINQHVRAVMDRPELALLALDTGQQVTRAQRIAEGLDLRGQLAQLPVQRGQLDLAAGQLADEPGRIAADRAVLSAQGNVLTAGRAERGAGAALANVSVVVHADGTVHLAEDAIKAAAQSAYDQVLRELSQALTEGSASGSTPPSDLAGARR